MKRKTYAELVAEGVSHNMAEILSLGCAPGLKTDTQFLTGRNRDFGTDDPVIVQRLRAAGADRNGVYHPALADYPGDPKAVFSSRDEIRKVCQKNGWACEGTVNVKGDFRPVQSIDVADHIVERETAKEIAKDPSKGETAKKRQATKEAVKARLKGRAAK